MKHFTCGEGAIASLSFTPNGESLVCVEAGRKEHLHRAVHWISLATGERQRTLDLNEEAWRQSISYAADRGGRPVAVQTGEAFVSPDGQWVAVQRYLGDPVLLDLWNAKTGKWKEIDLGRYYFVVDGVCFSAGSDLMIFANGTDGGGTKVLERLNLRSRRRLPGIDFPGYSVRQLRLSRDEKRLAALTYGSVFSIPHDRKRPDAGKSVELEMEISDSASIRFSPSGDELAVVDGPELFFWDCESPEAMKMTFGGQAVNDLGYSPDGRLLVLGCDDGTILIHDRDKGREAARYDWKIGRIVSVAFSADGMTAAAGGEGGKVALWDVDV